MHNEVGSSNIEQISDHGHMECINGKLYVSVSLETV